ncbi:MAG: nuclear transport factor 2 family protein [Gammaproteobacteria bacterium]|nr:nuclear transport factor 2 family protein [Gammaproteobacteria bacterium]
MTRDEYERYLRLFNAKDYDAVFDHFTDDCEIVFAGYCFKGKQTIRKFYTFFHAHTKESITLQRFLSEGSTVALEAIVRLEGLETVTPEMLAKRGLGRLAALPKGAVFEIPQFIHYHLENGKFKRALCAIFEPGRDVIADLP